jgi:hypothetical protein
MIDQCQTPRSMAKKRPAKRIEGGRWRVEGRFAFSFVSLPFTSYPYHAHSIGIANATRQNALATGPVSDNRTKIGAKAMEQPPARRHRNATVEARSLRESSFGSA